MSIMKCEAVLRITIAKSVIIISSLSSKNYKKERNTKL